MSTKKRKRPFGAGLNLNKTPPKKRKFNAPRIINQQKWKLSPKRNKTTKRKWKCIECNHMNHPTFVFCQQCTAEPPSSINNNDALLNITNRNINKQTIDDIAYNQNHKNSNNHNKNHHSVAIIKTNQNNKNGGYPDHNIAFDHISNEASRKYAHFLEKNIRREQQHHIEEFNEHFNKLQAFKEHNIEQFALHFPFKLILSDIDTNTHEKFVTLKAQKSTKKIQFGDLNIGASVLLICQCHFERIRDINEYFDRAIHGIIDGQKQNEFKVRVIRDKWNTLNNKKENLNDFLIDFEHETNKNECFWTLSVNNFGFYKQQLHHLDIFVNATIYQMPYLLFEYVSNAKVDWMQTAENEEKISKYTSMLSEYSLNESQQIAIAKALTYPFSLIHGPPGTGKTYTISHLASFIIRNGLKDSAQIIVIAAHSNCASDQIMETLMNNQNGLNKQRIVRFGAINKIKSNLKKYAFENRLKKNKQEYAQYTKMKKNGFDDKAMDILNKLAQNILMNEVDIVISSCYGCADPFLMNLDISISHLIIDEAAQITESEMLIPFNFIRDKRSFDRHSFKYFSSEPPNNECLKPLIHEQSDCDWKEMISDFDKKIILIGDQKQLSPIAHSDDAITNGFTLSMFDRLLSLTSIQRISQNIKSIQRERRKRLNRGTDSTINSELNEFGFQKARNVIGFTQEYMEKEEKIMAMIEENESVNKLELNEVESINYTLLNVQYRMKPFLIQFCNNMFYDNCIKTSENERRDGFVIRGFDWLDNDKSLVFVSLEYEKSKQIKTASGSYYNLAECEYINRIIGDVLRQNDEIKENDVGVIAMHRAQCKELKNMLNANGVKHVEVNTVDGFQGKEKKLIILSFVRTDGTSTSFLGNKKRCNVALTRAKYGMIVVGQLQQLKANKMWKKYAQFVEEYNVVRVVNNEFSQTF